MNKMTSRYLGTEVMFETEEENIMLISDEEQKEIWEEALDEQDSARCDEIERLDFEGWRRDEEAEEAEEKMMFAFVG